MDSPPASKQKLAPGDPAAFPHQTNIDRRKCHRVVPVKVIGLGLSRSGTASLRQALLDLDLDDCYHYSSVLNENPRDAEMWVQALEAKYEGRGEPFTREDWDQLLGHCMAITDTPCMVFWRELLAAYPDAKCILTVRDSTEQWYASQMSTVMPFFWTFVAPTNLAGKIYRALLPKTANDRMAALLYKHYMYKDLATNGKRFYEEHNAEVLRTVPKENLLVFNVKEGWEPLCKFLGVELPSYPFPRGNDRKAFQENGKKVVGILNRVVAVNAAKLLGVFGMSMTLAWYVFA